MPKPVHKTPGLEHSDFPKTSAPAERALLGAGYSMLEQLTKVSEAELLALHGMGPNAIGKLKEALMARGLSLRA